MSDDDLIGSQLRRSGFRSLLLRIGDPSRDEASGISQGSYDTDRLPGEVPDLDKQILLSFRIEELPVDILQNGELLVERDAVILLQIRIHDESAFLDELIAIRLVHEILDDLLRAARLHEREPSDERLLVLVDDDLDPIPVLQFAVERHDPTVHFGDCKVIPEVRVNRVGEIDRGGPLREIDDISFRGKDEDSVIEESELHGRHEFTIFLLLALIDNLLDLRDPVHVLCNLRLSGFGILEVGRHSDFGLDVHVLRAYLNLRRLGSQLPKDSHDRRVEALVPIRLLQGDIVLEPFRNRGPAIVDLSEDLVAVRNIISDYPYGEQIVEVLRVIVPFPNHLLIDAVR